MLPGFAEGPLTTGVCPLVSLTIETDMGRSNAMPQLSSEDQMTLQKYS